MERTKLYKSKLQMYLYTAIFIICLVLCIIIGTTDYTKDDVSDNIKFSNLYNKVSEDNVYKFINATEVLNIINGRSGIILMGFPTNKWTNYYANIVNEVAKEEKIDKIYYYDFLSDRENSNGTYETIVNDLEVYIRVDDLGNSDLIAPTLVAIKNGEVIGYFDDSTYLKGNILPDDYYTIDVVDKLKEELRMVFNEYKG